MMAFVLSGTVITQSGTDADLSGIAGISGVESYDHGVADFDYTIYDASDFELVITGTLNHDQFEEQLIVDQLTINSGGTYNIGITRDEPATAVDAYEAFVPILALHIKFRGAHPQNNPSFDIQSGGTLNWIGCMIFMHAGFHGYYDSASSQATINITDAYLYIEGLATINDLPYKLRFDGTDVNINKLKQYGGAFANQRVLDVFSGYEPTHFEGIQVPSQASRTELFVFENYAGGGRGNIQDCRWTETRMRFKNSATGSDLILKSHGINQGGANGMADVSKEIQLTITDSDAAAIVGARYYIIDYDNGNRANYTQNANNIIYDQDLEYTDITDAAGETPTVEVLTLAVVDNGANFDGTTKDYRSKNNNTDDLFDIFIWSYAHLSATFSQELKGIDVLNIPWTLFPDNNITESNSATVAAYTGIAIDHTEAAQTITITESHTLDEIYDFVKYNKTLAANIKFPTPGTLAVIASGDELQFPDYSIIVSGATTDLSEGTMFTKMAATNGTITTTADGTVSVPFSDSTGTQLIIKTNPPESLIRIEEFAADGMTPVGDIVIGTTDADFGKFSQKFASDANVRIYVKKWGYFFSKTNHDMTEGTELDIALTPIAHIDTTAEITDEVDPDTSFSFDYDAADPTASDRVVYFEFYVDTADDDNTKGIWRCGEINTSGFYIKTAAMLDHRISTQDGLSFFAWFDEKRVDPAVTTVTNEILGGRPYTWNHDRLEINESHLEFRRIAGMTGTQISRIGVPVKTSNETTNYVAPESQNSRVGFDNVAILIPVSSLEEIIAETRDAIERDDGVLATAAADAALIKKLQSADIEILGDNIIFKYEGVVVLTFTKRAVDVVTTDFSAGRTLVT